MKIYVKDQSVITEFTDISYLFDDGAIHLGWKPF